MVKAVTNFSPATLAGAVVSFGGKTQLKMNKITCIGGLSTYEGLKAHNSMVSLGLPVITEHCFAKVINSYKVTGRRGSALSAKCSKVDQILKIATIMNGLVLVGVAVGFLLLFIEASFEESE